MAAELLSSKLAKVAGTSAHHSVTFLSIEQCVLGMCVRLLMAPHGVITASKSGEDPGDGGRGWSRGCGLRGAAVLLCPNGHLLSFLIPFPTLVR